MPHKTNPIGLSFEHFYTHDEMFFSAHKTRQSVYEDGVFQHPIN
jgi:hypothetical protein